MKNFLKTIALCLVLAMTFAMVPVLPVFAADADVITVGENGDCTNVADAISKYTVAGLDGKTLKFVSDVHDTSNHTFEGNVTVVIDGNGFEWTLTTVVVKNATVTVKNIIAKKHDPDDTHPFVYFRGGSNVIAENCTVGTEWMYAFSANSAGDCHLTIESGVYTPYEALFGNVDLTNTVANTITINGGWFVHKNQMVFRGVKININGGTWFHCGTTRMFYQKTSSAAEGICALNISGGTFYTPIEQETLFTGSNDNNSFSWTGGTFYNVIENGQSGDQVKDGQPEKLDVNFTDHPTIEKLYVAGANGCTYSTLKSALSAATAGSEVWVVSDLVEPACANVSITKDLTINGNGFTVQNTNTYFIGVNGSSYDAATETEIAVVINNLNMVDLQVYGEVTMLETDDAATTYALSGNGMITVAQSATVTFNNCNVVGGDCRPVFGVRHGNNNLVINSGVYEGVIAMFAELSGANTTSKERNSITISGGTFKLEDQKAQAGMFFVYQFTDVIINGGDFYQSIVAPFVTFRELGSLVTLNGGNVYLPESLKHNEEVTYEEFDTLRSPTETIVSEGQESVTKFYRYYSAEESNALSGTQFVAAHATHSGYKNDDDIYNVKYDLYGYAGLQKKDNDDGTYDIRVIYIVKDVENLKKAGFVVAGTDVDVSYKANGEYTGVQHKEMNYYFSSINVNGSSCKSQNINDCAIQDGAIFVVLVTGVTEEQMTSESIYVNFYAEYDDGMIAQSGVKTTALSVLMN